MSTHKLNALIQRNLKLTLRDPLTFIFGLAFPVIMLVLMQLIFTNIATADVYQFRIENYASGIAIFGYTFIGLLTALNVTTDKTSAFITRIMVAPVSPYTLFLSYLLSALPLAVAQTVILLCISMIWMETITVGVLVAFIYLIPAMLAMICLGLLVGSLCRSTQQAGPICSVIITAAGLLGDIWMPLSSPGLEGLRTFCSFLPFYPSVNLGRAALSQSWADIYPDILIVLAWVIVLFVAATLIFRHSTKSDKK